MIDVHAPHESMHSWRDFLLHLVTITIGLLIALSLEGLVEWQHHRHLAHEAEASLHAEIKGNAAGVADALAALHENESKLKKDVDLLKHIAAVKHRSNQSFLAINVSIVTFDTVSWKTAQSTGALSYIPYDMDKDYAGIYSTQNELEESDKQAARDFIVSLGPFLDADDPADPDLTQAQAEDIMRNIETLQGQLLLVDGLLRSLDGQYKRFLAAHPS